VRETGGRASVHGRKGEWELCSVVNYWSRQARESGIRGINKQGGKKAVEKKKRKKRGFA